MYFVSGGHTFQVLEDAETVEFSPTEAHKVHMAKVAKKPLVGKSLSAVAAPQ